jgi:anthranilate synthase component 1
MTHLPSLESFANAAKTGRLVPVYRRLTSDTLTPVLAFHRLDSGECSGLFESVIGGEKVGRYSFLATDPFLRIEARGLEVTVYQNGTSETFTSDDPIDELERRIAEWPAVDLPELPPFVGGAIGYAAYDSVRYVEHLPNTPEDDRGLPDLAFAFFNSMVVFDHITKTVIVVALADTEAHATHEAAFREAAGRVDALVERLGTTEATPLGVTDIQSAGPVTLEYESNFTQQGFKDAVEKCQEYIKAGDIFQVVISQRLRTRVAVPAFEVYRTLRVVNPSPFMFYLRISDVTLVGASPEIMVRVMDGRVTNRPLAGTRPRGATPEEDLRLAEELLADPKERAEHVMLVDLGRNDVGRIARYGSVELSDVMTIERYSHVMHITSHVSGELAQGKTAFDALKSCLPAGTVSGAPKVRAMQIIDELEPTKRGPYAGAVGYIDFTGNMDTCIALRTVVVRGDVFDIQAGAGIVADSDPESEYQETLNKARGMLKAIELTKIRICGE